VDAFETPKIGPDDDGRNMRNSEQSATPDLKAEIKPSKEFFLCFDAPTDWNERVRWLRLSGWCVATSGEPLTQIRARIGGHTFPGSFDRERPDVVDHLGMPAAPRRCGFSVNLRVPPGKGDLELQVAAVDGRWRKAFARTIYGPTEQRREIDLADAYARYDWWFDRPADWNQPVRTLYISGWCIDRKGERIEGIRARIGHRKFPGNYGFERKDVGAIHGESPAFTQSGFTIAVPLRPGKSLLAIECKQAGTGWRRFFQHKVAGAGKNAPPADPLTPAEIGYFTLNPRTNSRFQFWLDRPDDWSRKVRYLQISGWCLAASGDPITAIRTRFRRKIFHATYGITRPDIAIKFDQHPGALRSGFSLDVILPRLPATLFLEAGDARGHWEPFFEHRVRGPFFWPKSDDVCEAVGNYTAWIRLHDRLTEADRTAIRAHLAQFRSQPLFSVLVPVYNPTPKWLERAIESVREQLYPHWELCVVDDASTDPRIWKLIEHYASRDPRIKGLKRAENGHICAASNDALQIATGEFIALLDHDDELAPTALYFAALELNRDPQLQLLYSDEDKLDKRGRRCDPYFKPDWNPDLFTSQNYVSHLSVYRTELARRVGGFRLGFEGSQDYDLTLRCVEQIKASQIRHIPRVLYHWRIAEQSTATFAAAKPYAHEAAIRAMQQHLDRLGIAAIAGPDYGDYMRVKYLHASESPLVSLVIPTRDRASFLRLCLESTFAKTEYPNYEIVVIDNDSSEPETLDYFASLQANEQVRVCRMPGAFNYSKLNNFGVNQARGDLILLLNNDIEAINGGWLDEMVSHGLRPEIGAIGARLWYPDGTMQHGGVILGAGGIAGHAHAGIRHEHGYFARAHLVQNFSAVTAACMLVKKDLYLRLGGLDEQNLAVAFNDVDFCLRLREAGFRILWTPHAELRHHESASRGFEDTATKQRRFLAEVEYMNRKWGDVLESDPCYNPNLSLGEKLFTLAFPPRLSKPWTVI
jgi:glycosyltransferase involved in cell wall biosynthesis